MNLVSIALAIPHCPWLPARVESMARLRGDLEVGEMGPAHYGVLSDKEPNWSWSQKMIGWAIEMGAMHNATHLVTLQDDARVRRPFWPAMHAMLHALPNEIIGLEAAHPAGPMVARSGMHLYTTSDFLVGVGWASSIPILRQYREWCIDSLRPGAIQSISEDTLLGLFCAATNRRIYHPVPTIIDHDTSLDSTYGNDSHTHRRPTVTWKDRDWGVELERVEFWKPGGDVPHLGRFYQATPYLFTRWVRDFKDEDASRIERDLVRVVRKEAAP
jgi:hypothetical protein